MSDNNCFGSKEQKSFDFASDVVKQQLTLASAIIALLVAVARMVAGDLGKFDVVVIVVASIVFFGSIVMGCWALMGLTHQLTTDTPSISNKGLRGKAVLQAILFVCGILATMVFGFSAAVAQQSDEDTIVTAPNEIIEMLPPELAQRDHAREFATRLAEWNSGELEFPSKEALRNTLETRLEAAVETFAMGYEDDEWRDRRLNQFDRLPETIMPSKPLTMGAVRSTLWAFSINLPLIEEQYEAGTLFRDNPLPFFLLLVEAQQSAISAETAGITASHVANAAFTWWTNDWPFCSSGRL